MDVVKRAVFFLIPFFLIILGCGVSSKSNKDKNIFVDYLSSNPGTLDPCFGVDVDEARIQAKIFNGLVRYDSDLRIIPDLAEGFSISEDGKTYTFKLRKNVKFHSGHTLSSADVIFTFKRLMSKQTASSRAWVLDQILGFDEFNSGKANEIVGLKAMDNLRIEITLKKPFSPFLGLLAMPACYILSKEKLYLSDDSKKLINGTGPFRVDVWNEDLSLDFATNKDYFAGKPEISGYRFRILSQTGVQESAFLTGGSDILELRDVNFNRFYNDAKYKKYIKTASALNVYYIGFNCQKKPYDDPRLRQAFNYAIDRKLLLKAYKNNQGILAHGSIPPGLPGYDESAQAYLYDPARAKKLLTQMGVSLPFKTSVWMKPNQENLDIVQAIQDQLKKVQIDLQIKKIDWAMLKEAINNGEPEMYFLAWFADYPDAENFLAPLFHSQNWGNGGNRARFKNNEIDALIEKSQKELQHSKRIAIYKEIDKKVYQLAPWVYLWHESKSVLLSPRVQGYVQTPIPHVLKGLKLKLAIK
ncbi:ABC transporter substrate-binding protein [Candidatus Riflebacteria bacterium]